jgi:hypothetical protein
VDEWTRQRASAASVTAIQLHLQRLVAAGFLRPTPGAAAWGPFQATLPELTPATA